MSPGDVRETPKEASSETKNRSIGRWRSQASRSRVPYPTDSRPTARDSHSTSPHTQARAPRRRVTQKMALHLLRLNMGTMPKPTLAHAPMTDHRRS